MARQHRLWKILNGNKSAHLLPELEPLKPYAEIDILTDEDAPVFAAEDGVVSAVYKDALLGNTVEITHGEGYKTVYSNLKDESTVIININSS